MSKSDERAEILKKYISATKRTKTRLLSIEAMAQVNCSESADNLNKGNVLNLTNGVLDLNNPQLNTHRRDDMLTYCLPYELDETAVCQRWPSFLDEVLVNADTFEPDAQLQDLFQELVGYSLTPQTHHEIMIWLYGNGANGKSVIIEVLKGLVGLMAISVDMHTIGQPGNYDLARLPDKRIVFSTESKQGKGIVEGLLKQIVSGETITARPIYGHPFEFNPICKIWWAMNDKPNIQDRSNAIWRRLKLIPFYRTFTKEEQDVHLADQLLSELPGILNWALDGLMRLRKNGRFTQVEAVDTAISNLKRENNPILEWLEVHTKILPYPATKSSDLLNDYNQWARKNGYEEFNNTKFGLELNRIPNVKREKKRFSLYNVGLATNEE